MWASTDAPIPKRKAGDEEAGPSLQQFLSLSAYAGGRRVAVIARADRLTEQAADTCSRPSRNRRRAPTSSSLPRTPSNCPRRCGRDARPSSSARVAAVIERWLERAHGVSEHDAATAAALAAGRPGRALHSPPSRGRSRASWMPSIDSSELVAEVRKARSALRRRSPWLPRPAPSGAPRFASRR